MSLLSVPHLFAVWLRHVLCCILVPLFVCRGTRHRFCAGAPFNLHQCQLCLACPGLGEVMVSGSVWQEAKQKVDTNHQGSGPPSQVSASCVTFIETKVSMLLLDDKALMCAK